MTKHFLQDRFGKDIEVRQHRQVLKIGDKVTWRVEPKRKGQEPFRATGRVTKIYTTTFGAHQRKQGAKIETEGQYLKVFPSRRHTTVAIDKLKHY